MPHPTETHQPLSRLPYIDNPPPITPRCSCDLTNFRSRGSTHQVITQYPSKSPPTHPPPAASYLAAPYSLGDPYSDLPPIAAAGFAEVGRVELFASALEVLVVLAVVGLFGEAAYKRIGIAPEAGGEGMPYVLRIFAIVGGELGVGEMRLHMAV